MIRYHEFFLENGLQVFVHEDNTVPVCVLNLLYKVGSRDEQPHKTGFAHLFEHLMFGGSKNIPVFDEPLQLVGGENNAFTSQDITNYYITLPADNIETAFWLESDRMLALNLDPESLEVQRKVVIEEFKQSYLNQPYGDAWLKLCPLSYETHPYQWATIGKEISHIEQATLTDVQHFFQQHYVPNNAVLVLAGKIKVNHAKALAEKWFGSIPRGKAFTPHCPMEAPQTQKQTLHVEAAVPANALYKTYHMGGRFDDSFIATDLLSDVLSRGDSSRLYTRLVQEKKIFSKLSAHVSGSLDPGLFIVNGRLQDGVSFDTAEAALHEELHQLTTAYLSNTEMEKLKNQYQSGFYFDQVDVLDRAMNLAFYSLSGKPEKADEEMAHVKAMTVEQLRDQAKQLFREENSHALYYHAVKN